MAEKSSSSRHWSVLRAALLKRHVCLWECFMVQASPPPSLPGPELFSRVVSLWEPKLRVWVNESMTYKALVQRLMQKSGSVEKLVSAMSVEIEAWGPPSIARAAELTAMLVQKHGARITKMETSSRPTEPERDEARGSDGGGALVDEEEVEGSVASCCLLVTLQLKPSSWSLGCCHEEEEPPVAYDFVELFVEWQQQPGGKTRDRRKKKTKLRLRQRRESQGVVSLREALSHRHCGVDNTGNVRVWPAEEVLLHLLVVQLDQVVAGTEEEEEEAGAEAWWAGKSVLELGGGMTGLTGIGVARCCPLVKRVVITDGNPACVDNMQVCIGLNWRSHKTPVMCSRLLWEVEEKEGQKMVPRLLRENGGQPFDVIMAADCLFFEDFHDGLLTVLRRLLAPQTGVAWLLQPERGQSMANFMARAAASFPQLEVRVVGHASAHDSYRFHRCRPEDESPPRPAPSADSSPPLVLLRVRHTSPYQRGEEGEGECRTTSLEESSPGVGSSSSSSSATTTGESAPEAAS